MAIPAKVRKEVNERDRWCRGCGKDGFHLHHIIFRSQGGPDEPWNLVRLCAACHSRAHNLVQQDPIRAWELKLVLHTGVPTVRSLRKRGLDVACGGCEYRMKDGTCWLWEHHVEIDYYCEAFRRRSERGTVQG